MGRILTLSGPAATTANLEVFTREELHTFRGTTGKTLDDTRLDQIVNGVNRALFDELRQRFIKATGSPFDIVFDGPGSGSLYLPHAPIVTLTSLNRGHYDTSGWVNDYTYISSELVQEDDQGRLTAIGAHSFPYARRQLRAIYTAGFAVIPNDLKMAALAWASVEYERASGLREDIVSVGFEGGATSYTFNSMPSASRAVFRRYMRKDQLVG